MQRSSFRRLELRALPGPLEAFPNASRPFVLELYPTCPRPEAHARLRLDPRGCAAQFNGAFALRGGNFGSLGFFCGSRLRLSAIAAMKAISASHTACWMGRLPAD